MAITKTLLPNTKTPEDPPEQIIGMKLPGNLSEGGLRDAQFFGHELARAGFGQLFERRFGVPFGALQRFDMPRAR